MAGDDAGLWRECLDQQPTAPLIKRLTGAEDSLRTLHSCAAPPRWLLSGCWPDLRPWSQDVANLKRNPQAAARGLTGCHRSTAGRHPRPAATRRHPVLAAGTRLRTSACPGLGRSAAPGPGVRGMVSGSPFRSGPLPGGPQALLELTNFAPAGLTTCSGGCTSLPAGQQKNRPDLDARQAALQRLNGTAGEIGPPRPAGTTAAARH